MKSSYNNKSKASGLTWNDKFELLDGSYLVSYSRLFWVYLKKKHGKNIHNPSVRIYVNEIEIMQM